MKRRMLLLAAFACSLAIFAQTEVTDSIEVPMFEDLDEVTVAARRPVMQTDGAKLTYNVDEDPASQSSTVLDILKKVPQVTVDGDGNVLLNGSGAFKFQVNGLDNPMLKQYAGQILQAMPASAVVKIEVITEPGAKEDAEGTSGIINIITERTQNNDGAGGTVSLQVGNKTLTPSLYGVLKKDKVTISANVNYQWGFSPQKSDQNTTATYSPSAGNGILKSNAGQEAKHHYLGGNLDMSWEPNPHNLFTAGVQIFYLDAYLNRIYNNTSYYSSPESRLWSMSQSGDGSMDVFSLQANASYRHNFSLENKNYLILSYLFNFGDNDLWLDLGYTDLLNISPANRFQRQATKTYSRGHTVQMDYANDFRSEHHLLEAGLKGIFRHNNAFSSYAYGNDAESLSPFTWLDSRIMQPQNIYAAYASYSGNFDKLGVVAGIRYEHTLMGITNLIYNEESFRTHLNDWVPNAALTWNFSPMSNLRLAYQMRISRPSIEQVNPYRLQLTPYEVRMGNPDLTSERNHIVSLKYSSFGQILGGSVGVEYNQANNSISGFTWVEPMDGGNMQTIITSYANIGKHQDVALTGLLTWNIIKNMIFSVNGRLAYNRLSAPSEGYRNHGWSGNIGGNWSYAVADVYKFSAYAAWNSRRINVQGYSTGYYYYGISASRDFLADKSLTLSVSANNFLQKGMTFKSVTDTPEMRYESVARNLEAWSVSVSLSWKFGSLNNRVKKTGAEIFNDDINSSSNKGQTGI